MSLQNGDKWDGGTRRSIKICVLAFHKDILMYTREIYIYYPNHIQVLYYTDILENGHQPEGPMRQNLLTHCGLGDFNEILDV